MVYFRIAKTTLSTFVRPSTYIKKSFLSVRSIHNSPRSSQFLEQLPKPQQNDQSKYENLVNSRFFALHRPLLSVNGNDGFLNTEAILPKTQEIPPSEDFHDSNFESELPEELVTNFSTIPEYVRMGPFAGTVLPPPSLFLPELPQDEGLLEKFFENIRRKYTEPSTEPTQLEQALNPSENKMEQEYESLQKKPKSLRKIAND